MLRNLSVLRDIHRIITEARARKQRAITFRDERGEMWQLVRVGDQAQNWRNKPYRPAATHPSRTVSSGV